MVKPAAQATEAEAGCGAKNRERRAIKWRGEAIKGGASAFS